MLWSGLDCASTDRRDPLASASGDLLASARRHGLFAAIVVEAALSLAAEPTGLDVLHQKRAGPVLGVGQALVEHLHDGETGVEADEVGQLEGPHGMIGAHAHGLVDGLDRAHA